MAGDSRGPRDPRPADEPGPADDRRVRADLLAAQWGGLLQYVRRRLGRGLRARETSVDLVQSICREALEDLDGLDYRGAPSFRRWLYTRAENKLRDRGRHWGRERRSAGREDAHLDPGVEPPAESPSPSSCAAARETLERVERAFAQLPEDHRRVILLARVEGLSHEAIARELGRSVLATRSLLSRALARLALALEEPGAAR